jgi:hypothetical protein
VTIKRSVFRVAERYISSLLKRPNVLKSVFFVEIETLKTHKRELAYTCDSIQKARTLFESKMADLIGMGYQPAPIHCTVQ